MIVDINQILLSNHSDVSKKQKESHATRKKGKRLNVTNDTKAATD